MKPTVVINYSICSFHFIRGSIGGTLNPSIPYHTRGSIALV